MTRRVRLGVAAERLGAARKARSARATPIGTLRPSIVLYDEPHPLGDDIGQLQTYDLSRQPDVLLIMGTSLKVHGLKRLVKDFAKAVHTPTTNGKRGTVIFVNATPPSKEWEGVIDVHVHGESDKWVAKVEEDWKRMRPQDWETQTLLDGEVAVLAGPSKATQKPKSRFALSFSKGGLTKQQYWANPIRTSLLHLIPLPSDPLDPYPIRPHRQFPNSPIWLYNPLRDPTHRRKTAHRHLCRLASAQRAPSRVGFP